MGPFFAVVTTIRRLVLLTGLCLLGTSASASADTYKSTLGPAQTSFKWAGHGVGSPATPCSNDGEFRCDSVVFTLESKGDLTITIDVEGSQIGPYPDFDLHLYKSDAGGAKGDAVAEAVSPSDDEKLVAAGLTAGAYLLEVHAPLSIGEDYAGAAKLSNFPVPPATAAPLPPAAAPKQEPKKKSKSSARSRCRAKARKIKNRRKRAAAMRRCDRRRR